MHFECEVCGRKLHKGDEVYYDNNSPYGDHEVFCSEDCFEQHVEKNLGDYIDIIKDETMRQKTLGKEDFKP